LSEEEVIGTVEAHNPFSRENESLWFNSNNRTRFYCPRCKRGQHTKGYDFPCSKECDCLCKTHYIARDGKTKIPYGLPDNTDSMEKDHPPTSPEFLEFLEMYKKSQEELKIKNPK